MKPRYAFFLTGIASLALLTMQCVIPNAGNGSDVGNSLVAGALYNTDGSFAKDAIVHIRPKNFLPDISRLTLAKRLARTDSAITNTSGRFTFDTTLDTGAYVIEAIKGNNAVLIDSVVVRSKDSTVHLPPDTLKPMGAIKGRITLSEGGDPQKVFICAFGIDRTVNVQLDGTFTFSNLAEGSYTLKLILELDRYGSLDTGNIKVTSAETTDVKTLMPLIDTTGATIAGVLYNPDGSPVKGVYVYINKESASGGYPGDIAGINVIGFCKTNQSGGFVLNSIAKGIYSITAEDGNNAILIDSFKVPDSTMTINLPPDTLKPKGAIKGTIKFRGNPPFSTDFLRIDIFIDGWRAQAQSDGTFISYFAAGAHKMRITSTGDCTGVFDTSNILINSAETTDIGTLTLPFPCAQSFTKATISYDTLNQLVTLKWNRLDTAFVKGVNIYRRNIVRDTSFSAPLNPSIVSDTVYIDSTGEQDQTYEYRIAAIDKNGAEGEKSAAIAVKIASNFVLDTVFDWYTSDMALAKNGEMYLLTGNSSIQVSDSTMQLKRVWNTAVTGSSIGIDERGLIFVGGIDSIFVVDTTGPVVDTIADVTKGEWVIRGGIKVKDSLIFALELSFPVSINVFSYQGIRQRAWEVGDATGPDFHSHIMMGDSNEIMVSTLAHITSYDYSGNKISEIALPDGANFRGCFSFDEKRRLLYFVGTGLLEGTSNRFANNTLYVMNSENKIIALYKIPRDVLVMPDELWVQKNGTVYLSGLGRGTCKLKPLF
jgi:hypothetical protein